MKLRYLPGQLRLVSVRAVALYLVVVMGVQIVAVCQHS